MARNNNKSRFKKIEPAVETLVFNLVPNGDQYIDLSQCASLMNRRFYRQGLNWAVSSIKIITAVSGVITVSKLPNTWVMSNAWEKSFRAYQQMNRNATEESGAQSIKGKFLDFKIYADAIHHAAGFGANLLPVDSLLTTAALGQWQPTELEIPSTSAAPGTVTTYELIAVGPNNPGAGSSGHNAKSVIQGYADSRGLPDIEDLNVPDDASANWMVALFNEGTSQDAAVISNLERMGDKAPYPFEDDGTNLDTMYPGGETNLPGLQIHDLDSVTGTTIGGITVMKGGNFPCGLMKINFTGDGAYALQIDLVPGSHRGYLCEPMTEM